MRTSLIVPSILVCIAGLGWSADGDGLRGAATILADLHAPVVAKAESAVTDYLTLAQVEAYAALPQRDAAGWLALVRRLKPVDYSELMGEDGKPAARPANSVALLTALPSAGEWPALIAGLRTFADGLPANQAQRAAGWRLVAATLANDSVAMHEAIDQARAASGRSRSWDVESAIDALTDREDDPQRVVQAVERRLLAAAKDHDASIDLPDLVALVGEERALPVIRSALALPLSQLEAKGRRTRALAVREALARIETLKTAPWGLIHDVDSVPLFEALEKRFAKDLTEQGHRYQIDQAEAAYVTQLIATKRVADAVARLDRVKDRLPHLLQQLPMDELAEHRPQELCDLIRDLLRKEPERPLWTIYAQLAGQLGRADELQQMLHDHRASAARQHQLVDLLLAADEIDGAVDSLRATLADVLHPPAVAPVAAKPVVPGADVTDDESDDDDGASESKPDGDELALRLLTLGSVLKRPELVSEAVVALAALPAVAASSWDQSVTRRTLLLVANGQAALAERLLAAELTVKPKNKWDHSAGASALAGLVRLYGAVGRPADAVAIITTADRWGVADLADVADGADAHEGRVPLAVIAGTAFADVGKLDEAWRLGLLALEQAPACDAAYALLRRLDPAKAGAVFERMRRTDALEERPLIWLAQLQLDAGKPAEAEKLARQAMEIDPSDGDQGPGDRMRARAVLADALEKLGRVDDAKPLRTAVTAIRAGESADIFLRAGLATRAAEAYRASEAILDRTYCVQSRMAVTLAKLGREQEAAVHFRRAFELMPKAFGRMESHCFGCEGVFGGAGSKRIAEEVFTGLVAREPKNPKHQYLLGYLRMEQGRHAEAADAFRAAIALDPDYFSAVRHLLGLDDELRLPRAERERLAMTLARLDPANHHGGWSVAQIQDLAGLSTLLASHAEDLHQISRPVLTLPHPPVKPQRGHWSDMGSSRRNLYDPSAVIASHPILGVARGLIDRSE